MMRDHIRRLCHFTGVGIINTAFGYGVYGAAVLLGLTPAAALAVATSLGALFNYFTTARLVFAERRLHRLPQFLLVYALLYGANLGLLKMILALGVPPLPAQALALPFVVCASYAAMTFWIFAPPKDRQSP